MTSKIIVNTIEADTGISSVTFASNINLQNDSSVLVSSSGVTLGTGSTIAAPSANEIALSTNNAERIRVDSSGRLLIGRTSALASSAERLTIDDGMAIFRRSSANAAALYIRNEDSTADTRQPYLIFMDGGGNRGGFGVQNDQSSLWISGQNGIAFRTSGSAPSQNERLRITTGGFVNIGGNFTQTNYTAQVTRIGGNTDVMQIKGNVGNAFIRFADNDATSDFTLGSDDGSGAGTGAFILYDRNNSAYRAVVNSSGNIGINRSNPTQKIHMSGAIRQDGAHSNVQYHQACFAFGSGSTHTIYTLSGNGNDATAIAVFEYVCLYAYAGINHEAGIIYASTRRTNNNSAWGDIDNIAASQAGNDSSIRPTLFWDNGVLKITVGTSVQCTGTLRLTTRRFTVTRNYSAG